MNKPKPGLVKDVISGLAVSAVFGAIAMLTMNDMWHTHTGFGGWWLVFILLLMVVRAGVFLEDLSNGKIPGNDEGGPYV
jgi:membrane protein insertase Oxa1/YidC/SpoIIIJ